MASHHDAAAMSEDRAGAGVEEELLSESGSESDPAEGSEEEVRAAPPSPGPPSRLRGPCGRLRAASCPIGQPPAPKPARRAPRGPAGAALAPPATPPAPPLLAACRWAPGSPGSAASRAMSSTARWALHGGMRRARSTQAQARGGLLPTERRPRRRAGCTQADVQSTLLLSFACSLPQVAEDYIQDDFNLSGLSSQVRAGGDPGGAGVHCR